VRGVVQADLERKVVAMLNVERRRAGLDPLTAVPLLGVSARAHSADMAARHYLDHVSPEGETVADRVARTGYGFQVVGENIAWGQRDARQVMTAWMHSRGHKANILSPHYTEVGVGVAAGKQGALVWTQNFATPALA
jgi:uncharacterized protein YkwD